MKVTADEAYSYFEEKSKAPNNYDLHINVFEYDPTQKVKEDRFKDVFKGYFPYAKVFPYKDAHLFGKFVLDTTGDITDEDGNVFKAEKGKYYTFVLIYKYYRAKKKTKVKWKRIDVFNE